MKAGDAAGRVGELSDLERELEQHARGLLEAFPDGSAEVRREVRCFFSPGRVNLMGAHLDYSGGPVMPMAIDRGTFIAVRRRDDGRIVMRSTHEHPGADGEASEPGFGFDLRQPPERRSGLWYDYPCGVLRNLVHRAPRPTGLDLYFGGNLPIGAGLSSSASICVGTAFAVDTVWELGLSALERVEVALEAEREFVGVRCGLMDPYAVGMAREGQLLWLDCKDASIEHLPLDTSTVGVAVADSGIRRELAAGAFNQRVAESAEAFARLRPFARDSTCLRDVPLEVLERHASELDPLLARRARHVLEEVRRTFEARAALIAGDLATFGARMTEAHASLRDLYEVSVPELDLLVEVAAGCEDVHGSRLTGAGFGGCTVILLRKHAAPQVLERVAAAFEQRFGRRPRIDLFGGDAGPREVGSGGPLA